MKGTGARKLSNSIPAIRSSIGHRWRQSTSRSTVTHIDVITDDRRRRWTYERGSCETNWFEWCRCCCLYDRWRRFETNGWRRQSSRCFVDQMPVDVMSIEFSAVVANVRLRISTNNTFVNEVSLNLGLRSIVENQKVSLHFGRTPKAQKSSSRSARRKRKTNMRGAARSTRTLRSAGFL